MRFPKKTQKRKIALISAFLLIIFLVFFLLGENIRSLFFSASKNIQRFFWVKGQNASSFFSGIMHGSTFKNENEALRGENQLLLSRLTEFQSIKKENEELRNLLLLRPSKKFQYVDGNIFSRSVDGNAVFISRGLKDEVKEGQAVINAQNIFLGKIKKSYQENALVSLINDPAFKLNVEIGDSKIEGIAAGGAAMLINNLPKDKDVREGDMVFTGSFQENAPRGLLVGTVEKVKKTDLSSFQEIKIAPLADLKNLDIVFVIINF